MEVTGQGGALASRDWHVEVTGQGVHWPQKTSEANAQTSTQSMTLKVSIQDYPQ